MIVFISLIFLLYGFGLLWYTFKVKKLKSIPTDCKKSMDFTIIIAAKNETNRIHLLLNSLQNLQYSNGKYEILLMDDYSVDNLKDFCNNYNILNFKYLKNEFDTGKANAIKYAIEKSNFCNLVLLDADVAFESNFLDNICLSLSDYSYDLALGNIVFKTKNKTLCGFYSEVESSTLVNLALIDAITNNPTMANGANMVINKKSLDKIGGYPTYTNFKAGEDTLLIQKFAPFCNIRVLNLSCKVFTFVETNWMAYLIQKKRWLNKSKYFKGKDRIKMVAVETMYNFMFLSFVYLSLKQQWYWVFGFIIFKTIVDIIWVLTLKKMNQIQVNIWVTLTLPFFQVLLMPFVFIYSKFGKINWR